jgi:CheY-like chemotaxis protein
VVTLLLRRSDGAAEAVVDQAAEPAILAPQAGRTVLVVDDEDGVRALACEILELLGYRVLAAEGAIPALEVLEREQPDIMLFDYAMPGMNGAELARIARRRYPETPIIFASGYADTAQVEAALGGDAVILRKPFDMETLARTVAGLLAAPDASAAAD